MSAGTLGSEPCLLQVQTVIKPLPWDTMQASLTSLCLNPTLYSPARGMERTEPRGNQRDLSVKLESLVAAIVFMDFSEFIKWKYIYGTIFQ